MCAENTEGGIPIEQGMNGFEGMEISDDKIYDAVFEALRINEDVEARVLAENILIRLNSPDAVDANTRQKVLAFLGNEENIQKLTDELSVVNWLLTPKTKGTPEEESNTEEIEKQIREKIAQITLELETIDVSTIDMNRLTMSPEAFKRTRKKIWKENKQ